MHRWGANHGWSLLTRNDSRKKPFGHLLHKEE